VTGDNGYSINFVVDITADMAEDVQCN